MFDENESVNAKDSFNRLSSTSGLLSRLFSGQGKVQQVAIEDGSQELCAKVVKDAKEVPSNPLQIPSDPEVSCSGDKGRGYLDPIDGDSRLNSRRPVRFKYKYCKARLCRRCWCPWAQGLDSGYRQNWWIRPETWNLKRRSVAQLMGAAII
jgi:hypothetical protein